MSFCGRIRDNGTEEVLCTVEVALVLELNDDDDMTTGIGGLEKADDGTATGAGTDDVVVVVKWGTWPFCNSVVGGAGMGL